MDRHVLLAHLRRTRFAPGDRDQAQAEARTIAAYLKREHGAVRVIGFGSAFVDDPPFRRSSDLDLAVAGLPPVERYRASARAADLTRLAFDLTPLESATPLLRERVRRERVAL